MSSNRKHQLIYQMLLEICSAKCLRENSSVHHKVDAMSLAFSSHQFFKPEDNCFTMLQMSLLVFLLNIINTLVEYLQWIMWLYFAFPFTTKAMDD